MKNETKAPIIQGATDFEIYVLKSNTGVVALKQRFILTDHFAQLFF